MRLLPGDAPWGALPSPWRLRWLADLAYQVPGATGWPRFVRHRSEPLEARRRLLRIDAGRRASCATWRARGSGRARQQPAR